MAIVVPFLMSATGASAAIGAAVGVSATVVSAVTSVVFQVSGINDKINKAATKVFGEDLVKFANIAGVAYGAINGGFDIGGGAEGGAGAASAIDASSSMAVNGMDAASDAFSAAGGVASDGFEAMTGELGKAALDGTSSFGANSAPNSFNLAEQAGMADTVTPESGLNALNPEQPLGTDTKMMSVAEEGVTRAKGATGASASAADATASKYALRPGATAQSAAGQSAAGSIRAPGGLGVTAPANALSGTNSGNVFTRMFGDMSEKTKLGLLQGVAGGVDSAMKAKAAKKQQDEQMAWIKERYYNSAPSIRVVG